jgi:hypothetical protein
MPADFLFLSAQICVIGGSNKDRFVKCIILRKTGWRMICLKFSRSKPMKNTAGDGESSSIRHFPPANNDPKP